MLPRDAIEVINERGQRQFFDDDVHRALAAVGLIWREGKRWRCHSSRVDLGTMPELALCDFCTERPVTWDIDAETFRVDGTDFQSTGGWMACETCGRHVEAGDRAALAARAVALVHRRVPEGLPRSVSEVWQLRFLELFWEHYRGIRRCQSPYVQRRSEER